MSKKLKQTIAVIICLTVWAVIAGLVANFFNNLPDKRSDLNYCVAP